MSGIRKQVNVANSATATSFIAKRFLLSKAKQKQFQVMNSRVEGWLMEPSAFLQIVIVPVETIIAEA